VKQLRWMRKEELVVCMENKRNKNINSIEELTG
jgi:hypothetical protein